MSREDFQAVSDFYKGQKKNRVDNFYKTRLDAIKKMVANYPNLEYKQISEYHHRIKRIDNRLFIDFWQTGTMKDMKNGYYGMGYKDSNINREIRKLALYADL